jgi:orotate phosphoribosyltransferase
MTKEQLGIEIYKAAYLRGEFLLRSGIISNEYFDKYQFESSPDLIEEIAKQISENIPTAYDLLGGLEMGGIPIATALSLVTRDKVVFIRKEAKKYGTAKLAEGPDFKGKKILLVEDVVTSGGQIIISAEEIRQMGGVITHAVCVIDREQGGPEKLLSAGIELIPLFTMSEIKSWIK